VHDAQALRGRYLRAHLKRAALLGVACSLPMLAAYAHFSWRLSQARQTVGRFEDTVQRMRDQGQAVSGSVAQEQVLAAGQAMDRMWRATGYWPLLPYSFSAPREDLRKRLTRGIREAHLRPALERCHAQPDTCRPEQVVFLLAALHASSAEPLGQFVLSSLRNRRSWSFEDPREASSSAEPTGLESGRSWLTAVNLVESLVGDYVVISDRPWQAPNTPEADWARWPFREAFTLEGQLAPWQAHLKRLHEFLRGQAVEPWELDRLNSELEALREERGRLRAWLEDSATFATLPRALDLLQASEARVDASRFMGLSSTLQALEWMNKNREPLAGVLQMEEELYQGLKAAQKMSVAELLVRDGLWVPGASTRGPFQVTVTQGPLEFYPVDSSRQLHQAILRYYERTGRLPFGSARSEEEGASRLATASVFEARLAFDTRIRPLVDEFTLRLKNAQLPVEEAAQRQEHVRRQVDQFALRYRQRLFQRVRDYHFDAPTPTALSEALTRLLQPSSELVDMLRDTAKGASLEPLEGPYYESLRNAVAPFTPIVQVMKPDERGNHALLTPYRTLVAQLTDELHATSRGGARATATPAEQGRSSKEGPGAARLTELLTPLGRVALSMMLEEEGSYLRKVDAWLDQQGLIGELREPFRQPFLRVRALGQQEVERTLRQQWEGTWEHLLRPLMSRYPFNPEATQEVEPGDLEVLRRRDGEFWSFVDRVVAPLGEERGTEWVLRGALQERLTPPEDLLPMLSRLSRLSKALWDAEGRPRPLMLQVMALPLPAAPRPGSFVTLGSLKCGRTAAFAYNQSPSWQAFALDWWDQQTASLVLELRSPEHQAIQYASLPKARSAWSCFRLLEESLPTGEQQRLWRLRARSAESTQHAMELRFGIRGEPWALFREVPR
jgi:type VI secretion system protein ImpL